MSKRNAERYARIRREREAARDAEIARLIAGGCAHIEECPDYLVSPTGDVYSTFGRRVIKLSPGVKPGGYEFVGLKGGGNAVYRMVHRLVALAFIPNPEGLPEVNHLDGNKRNNTVANLEWCTRKGNQIHAAENGLLSEGERHPPSKLNADQVREIAMARGRYRDIGMRYGICAQSVCNIKRGKTYRSVSRASC